jgi:hypothetical protein
LGAEAAADRLLVVGRSLLVELLGELLAGVHQSLGGGAHGLDVVTAQADLRSASGSSTDWRSSAEILSPCSLSSFSVW